MKRRPQLMIQYYLITSEGLPKDHANLFLIGFLYFAGAVEKLEMYEEGLGCILDLLCACRVILKY